MSNTSSFNSIFHSKIDSKPIQAFIDDPELEYSFVDNGQKKHSIHKLSYKNPAKVLSFFIDEGKISYNQLDSLIKMYIVLDFMISKASTLNTESDDLFLSLSLKTKPFILELYQFNMNGKTLFVLKLASFKLKYMGDLNKFYGINEKCDFTTDSIYYDLLSYIDKSLKEVLKLDNYNFFDVYNFFKESSYSFYSELFKNQDINIIHDEQFINSIQYEKIRIANAKTLNKQRPKDDYSESPFFKGLNCKDDEVIFILNNTKENELHNSDLYIPKEEIISYLKDETYLTCMLHDNHLFDLKNILSETLTDISISYILSIVSLHNFKMKLYYPDYSISEENFFVLEKKLVDNSSKNGNKYFLIIHYRGLIIQLNQCGIMLNHSSELRYLVYMSTSQISDFYLMNTSLFDSYNDYSNLVFNEICQKLSIDKEEVNSSHLDIWDMVNC